MVTNSVAKLCLRQSVAAEVENIEPILLPKGMQPDDLSAHELRSFLRLPLTFEGALTVVEDHPLLQSERA